MDEKEFFNRDSMFWREVNAMSANMNAEIELMTSIEIDGQFITNIACVLLAFESADIIHEMDGGGAFKKNEVTAWPYVLLDDLAFYNDSSKSESERKSKVRKIEHSKVQAIILKDETGTVILRKTKI